MEIDKYDIILTRDRDIHTKRPSSMYHKWRIQFLLEGSYKKNFFYIYETKN